MGKESAVYAEHVVDLLTEILHETITIRPLQNLGEDITPSLAQELQFVFQHGTCSVRDIAQGLTMTYSAASQLTDRLVKKELVTRSENKQDRRLSEIRLTSKGHKLVERIRSARMMSMARILDRIDVGHRTALVEHLERFIGAAIEDGQAALETCSHCGKDHISECVINELYRAATGMPIERT